MCIGIAPYTTVINEVSSTRLYAKNGTHFTRKIVSAKFLLGNVLPGGELQIDAKNFNFEIFVSTFFMKSRSMLQVLTQIRNIQMRHFGAWHGQKFRLPQRVIMFTVIIQNCFCHTQKSSSRTIPTHPEVAFFFFLFFFNFPFRVQCSWNITTDTAYAKTFANTHVSMECLAVKSTLQKNLKHKALSVRALVLIRSSARHWCRGCRCMQLYSHRCTIQKEARQWRNFAWGCPWARDGWVPHWLRSACAKCKKSKRATRASLAAWGPGARLRAPVGSRGKAPPVYFNAEEYFPCKLKPIDHSHIVSIRPGWAHSAKSGRKHYNPPPLTVMWMNFDSPNFPSLCSLSAIISFQTCSNKCILYILLFHKCIKTKYKTVNMYGLFLWLVQSLYRWNTIHSHRNYHVPTAECSGRRILSPGQIAIINTVWE